MDSYFLPTTQTGKTALARLILTSILLLLPYFLSSYFRKDMKTTFKGLQQLFLAN
jgi:hypothetical protein